MSSRLDGAVVVVAGAGGTAGAAVVHRLARDRAVVVVAGRSEGPLRALAEDVERAGGQAPTSSTSSTSTPCGYGWDSSGSSTDTWTGSSTSLAAS